MSNTFKALVLEQEDGKTIASVQQLEQSQLPEGEVIVDVAYSSLNYKDGLAITGTGKIIRDFPMVPGIDFAGTVSSSTDERYQAGDKVILTGWGVGERYWGGIAEKASVKGDWLVPMPISSMPISTPISMPMPSGSAGSSEFDCKKAMIIGTAGLTAMLCVQALIDHGVTPESGDVLVTGASGGVGSVAVTLLAKLGYKVTAVTGRADSNGDWLKSLGATDIVERSEFTEPAKPLGKARWAGAIDTVGSHVLAKVLSQVDYGGAVAICGLAGGADLPTTVMPFILRGVNLLGIDSVQCPRDKRIAAWNKIVELLPDSFYDEVGQEVGLDGVVDAAEKIIKGQIKGRTLIKL